MRSMTGFGRSVSTTSLGTLTIEIKSVNHRYCQVSLRLPSELNEFESHATALLKERAARGQLAVSVEIAPLPDTETTPVRMNYALAKAYAAQVKTLRGMLGIEGPFPLDSLLSLPGVIVMEEPTISDEERWWALKTGIEAAWEQVARMRHTEGEALCAEMAARLETVGKLREQIQANIPDLIAYYRERLAKRILELTRNGLEIDEARIAMEAGLLADRADVTEELTRLESHLRQYENYLSSEEPVGRQMDFLLQEMHREANTIGSKAVQADVVALCVAVKTEIERLREQAQNVE